MNKQTQKGIISYLEPLLALLALGYILEFIVIGQIRLFYPYELEWIEGAKIDEMRWILDGRFLYTPPTILSIPLCYTPLFFYLSASLMKIIGVGFVAPRLISIFSTSGCFFLLYKVVRKETGRRLPGIIAAGVFAACYQFTGTWMDLVKVDSLFLFLVLVSFFIGLEPRNAWKSVASGTLFAAAFFAKQVALPIFLVQAPVSLLITKGKTWLQWLTTCAVGMLVFWMINKASNGWFSFYNFQTILLHPRDPVWWIFWKSTLSKMWPSFLVALIYMVTIIPGTKPLDEPWSRTSLQYLGFAVALMTASWINSLKIWSYKNTLMPACMGLALLTGLGLHNTRNVRVWMGKYTCDFPILKITAIILLFLQFALLFYNPVDQIPTLKERQAAQAIVERLRDLPGEVLVFNHGFVNHLAGKTTYLHSAPLGDVLIGMPVPGSGTYWRREEVNQVLEQALSEQRFDWVVIDTPFISWPPYYIYASKFIEDNGASYPGRGTSMVPKSLMVKNPVAHGGTLPLNDRILDNLFLEGWGEREEWGRWSTGDDAIVSVSLEKGPSYKITIVAHPFCVENIPLVQSMQVVWNDQPIGSDGFTSCENHYLEIAISKDIVNKDINILHFIFKRPLPLSRSDTHSQSPDSPSVGFSLIQFTQK